PGEAERESLSRNLGECTKGWDPGLFERAERVVQAAQALCGADDALVASTVRRLLPFAGGFRDTLARAGIVSFDGLLVRARDLLRDRLDVREKLQSRYRAILVDEFQDTDPLQVEIILFLAERPGGKARSARDVIPEPGRLFIVGDPKQSIYAFRRADIEAYHDVVERQVGGERGGLACDLTSCFRMHDRLVGAVNAVFARLIVRDGGVQPSYEPLYPRPGKATLPSQRVEVRLAMPAGGRAWKAEEAHAAEAEALARWMRSTLLAGEKIVAKEGERTVRAGDVAILFRAMTAAPAYLEALRRWGIPFVVDGEKNFFRTQEVADFLALLQVLAWPLDALALAGVLRSPLGGMTDAEVAALGSAGGFDLMSEGVEGPPLFATLRALRGEVLRMGAGDAVEHVLENLPVLEAEAASRGEQAASNLRKIASLARAQGAAVGLDFPAWVRSAAERMGALEAEGESPLAEESADAVRVLTIHKAKGLEFPVVIVPAMQTGRGGSPPRVEVRRDWVTGCFGIRVGDLHNVGEAFVREREVLREEAEQKRLFYVAATRARERLVLSGARTARRGGEAFLSFLEEATGVLDGETPGEAQVALDGASPDGASLARVLEEVDPTRPGGEAPLEAKAKWPDADALVRMWEKRRAHAESVGAVKRSTAPSRLHGEEVGSRSGVGAAPRDVASITGTVAHRILARIDFGESARSLARLLDPVLDGALPAHLKGRRGDIRGDVDGVLGRFFRSRVFADIARSRILGREVPCLAPVPEDGVLLPMEGAIDLLLERDGEAVAVDYKSDTVASGKEGERAKKYLGQGKAYVRAAGEALGRPVAFEVVFLRTASRVRLLPPVS
ncbi:MAG: UvrD-helicase domain-containing protein, partial [Planctomycetes bacterium]|nr:UvrD-helicase domain-containing protein [Planctomycetota bacterium]